ncbi:metal-dependent transcriptional regulator [Arachnia propionica]|uniref:Metal-dependent transcriptional regulator n=1 Tax=Arachnia propionica TaxID=1750 RepID=A0A3P1WVH5_9ACTN|nr:metal-dependent transcriptional regulator [Arachnia propionica]RRD48373.1 metal-dependent transcriptional regulator [Arachnia propionica]
MSELIDTTEMYLRTVYELIEEGVPPLRARIAERLHQSGPTVSQTVARMERDGLLTVSPDRIIKLTPKGAKLARDVMRKHRLAECLLTQVIGLEWDKVHDEACRWEHVISEDVEARLVKILDGPTISPYGNPIPGLADLGLKKKTESFGDGVVPLSQVVPNRGEVKATLQRMSENLQADAEVLSAIAALGLRPGMEFLVRRAGLALRLIVGEEAVTLDEGVAELLFVTTPGS